MSDPRTRTVRLGVLAASGVVVVLSGALAAALRGHTGSPAPTVPAAPAGTIPAPHPCDLKTLAIPCWSCPSAEKWPLRFVTDLDMLAPLGTGTANAAEWFAAFAKPNGPRAAEADAAMARRADRPPIGQVLPPGDPLVVEAAPWCDQATMRFYPGIFPVRGDETRIPNLLFMLTLARSWLARGLDAPGFDDAMADYRRVIRLGRLLRQEDAVLINDLVGLACIRIGAEAIYDRARRGGKTELALLAAVVAAEAPPQKYLSASRVTSVEIAPYLRNTAGSFALDLPEARFKAIREVAASCADRRFRTESALSLRYVAALGAGPMRADARELLEKLAAGPDPIVAANARWSLDTPVTETDARRLLGRDQ
jgi:hypothetical protein